MVVVVVHVVVVLVVLVLVVVLVVLVLVVVVLVVVLVLVLVVVVLVVLVLVLVVVVVVVLVLVVVVVVHVVVVLVVVLVVVVLVAVSVASEHVGVELDGGHLLGRGENRCAVGLRRGKSVRQRLFEFQAVLHDQVGRVEPGAVGHGRLEVVRVGDRRDDGLHLGQPAARHVLGDVRPDRRGGDDLGRRLVAVAVGRGRWGLAGRGRRGGRWRGRGFGLLVGSGCGRLGRACGRSSVGGLLRGATRQHECQSAADCDRSPKRRPAHCGESATGVRCGIEIQNEIHAREHTAIENRSHY